MPRYQAPIKDTLFVLEHIVTLGHYANLPGFADASPDLVATILTEGARFCEGVLQPLNQSGDAQGCVRHEDGSVATPLGFKAAYDQLIAAGWNGLNAPADFGGQGLPHVVATAFEEYMIAANMAFAMYPGLTKGAIEAILAVGSDALKAAYLPSMVAGTWTGTMNLTEPHCGTDLGLLRTRATVQPDGSYTLTGTKIFISSGEHDLAENIIHLVLAKIDGAPDSVKGISLFLVPKFLVQEDGTLGARNAVSCGSIEHKMGIHGNSTCVMNYDGATGWLLGEPEKGLRAMFIMMNAARLGVGLQGLALAEVAYQNGAAYARERVQGRALTGAANPADKADPIIVHPDVRRMLMEARAVIEGGRALILWGNLQVDLAHQAATEAERQAADDLISLLTPVIKGFLTDKGYEIATNMQQVLGGHGYVREWGMEQFVRDARIAMIYEGANGVQALDLVGRKLALNGGRALRAYLALVTEEATTLKADPRTQSLGEGLERAVGQLQAATMWLMQNAPGNPNNAGAASYAYMQMLGLVSLAWMWGKMARVAHEIQDQGVAEQDFYTHKQITARYFFERVLPDVTALKRKIEAGADSMMALPADAF